VRGQMLALKPASQPSRRVLESEEVYLVPRDDGRLLVGATAEDRGFRRGLSADGIHGVLDACLRLVPTLSPAPIVEFWSGFRPGTPDGLPILGEHPGVERLYLASGHFRNGILLAPATARAMGALIAGTDEPGPPPEFHPGRFHGDGAPAPSPRVKE
jgi:glycine/D-amino acid oxidase-like deaminating enzyme